MYISLIVFSLHCLPQNDFQRDENKIKVSPRKFINLYCQTDYNVTKVMVTIINAIYDIENEQMANSCN